LQTFSQWKYDPSSKYLDSKVEHPQPVEGLAMFEFTPVKREKPFDVTLAKGWKAEDKGHWTMYIPPIFPVGMDIYEMGTYSVDDPLAEKELLKKVPTDVSMNWARRLQQSPAPEALKPAKVGPYDAVFFEFTFQSPQGQEVHWRQWVFMVGNKCYSAISTIFSPLDGQIFPDVEKMLASFQMKTPRVIAEPPADNSPPNSAVPGAPPAAAGAVPGAPPAARNADGAGAVPGAPPGDSPRVPQPR
jgi:hypothetical protein